MTSKSPPGGGRTSSPGPPHALCPANVLSAVTPSPHHRHLSPRRHVTLLQLNAQLAEDRVKAFRDEADRSRLAAPLRVRAGWWHRRSTGSPLTIPGEVALPVQPLRATEA